MIYKKKRNNNHRKFLYSRTKRSISLSSGNTSSLLRFIPLINQVSVSNPEKKRNSIFVQNFSRNDCFRLFRSWREKEVQTVWRIPRQRIRNTMMEKWEKRKRKRGKKENDEVRRVFWKLLRQVLLFDKLKNGGAFVWSLARFRGTGRNNEVARKKRKPTKSFNHGAGSLLFLLALASPVYVRKLFSLPLLFFLLLSRLYPFLPFYF